MSKITTKINKVLNEDSTNRLSQLRTSTETNNLISNMFKNLNIPKEQQDAWLDIIELAYEDGLAKVMRMSMKRG